MDSRPNFCSNCNSIFLEDHENRTTGLHEKLPNIKSMLWSIYKLDYLTQFMTHNNRNLVEESMEEMKMCDSCLTILLKLYKYYDELNRLRQLNSTLSVKLEQLSTVMNRLSTNGTIDWSQIFPTTTSPTLYAHDKLISTNNYSINEAGYTSPFSEPFSDEVWPDDGADAHILNTPPHTKEEEEGFTIKTEIDKDFSPSIPQQPLIPQSDERGPWIKLVRLTQEEIQRNSKTHSSVPTGRKQDGRPIKKLGKNTSHIKVTSNTVDKLKSEDNEIETSVVDKYFGPTYPCPTCGLACMEKSSFRKHMKTKHVGQKISCFLCKKSFAKFETLKVHLKSFHEVKKFECPECHKWFKRSDHLRVHIRTHNDIISPCSSSLTNEDSETKDIVSSFPSLPKSEKRQKQKDSKTPPKSVVQKFFGPSFTCPTCSIQFNNEKSAFVLHIKMEHANDEKSCHICQKSFIKFDSLKTHLQSMHGGNRLQCPDCPKSFSRLYHHRLHGERFHKPVSNINHPFLGPDGQELQNENTVSNNMALKSYVDKFFGPSYQCPSCPIQFNDNKPGFMLHIRMEHQNDQKNCFLCTKSYIKFDNLRAHLAVSHGARKHKCPICVKTFTMRHHLRKHYRLHSGAKAKGSPSDGSSQQMSGELEYNSNDEPPGYVVDKYFGPNYICPTCSIPCMKKSALLLHLRREHEGQMKKCPHCERSFEQFSALKNHIPNVHGEKKHKCPLCPKGFTKSQQMRLHYNSHKGIRESLCPICGKTQRDSASLKIHLRRHGEERPFECPVCKKSFKVLGTLRQHERIHDEVRKFLCMICGQSFAQHPALSTHMKGHKSRGE